MTDEQYPTIFMPQRYYDMLEGARFETGVSGPVSGLNVGQELWINDETGECFVWDYRYGADGTGSGIVEGPFTHTEIDDRYPWLL